MAEVAGAVHDALVAGGAELVGVAGAHTEVVHSIFDGVAEFIQREWNCYFYF